ncbi:MAG TPA: TRAP transporter substrate-binding protein DctP [Acidimicrobiia bacterium]|nr:TRAP transporter substrate-binding protein DctP [Acidimicrobiia bacterium]
MRRMLVGIAALSLAITACVSSNMGEGEASKAGGQGTPIVLRIGTDDFPGRPAANQIEEFARRVADLSDGQIVIEPTWRAGDDAADWDQVVARKVMNGDLEMGNVPSRAWDTEGVTSMQALNAPFLITSDELLDAVALDALADEMLVGLEDVGVVGLALLPESLRRTFGFAGPLLGPDDFAGATIRSPQSGTVSAIFTALGAEVTTESPNVHTQTGMESAFHFDVTGSATGNMTLFPKANTLVINAATFAGLTDQQRAVLEQAAADTLVWAIENRPRDLEAAAAFCEEGGTIVLAGEEELEALHQAVGPVYAELETDNQTKEFIERIRRIDAELGVPVAYPQPCSGAEGENGSDGTAGSDINVLDGIYRFELTRDGLEAAGVPPRMIEGNVGIWTVVLQGGSFSIREDGVDHLDARYVIDGDVVTFTYRDGVVTVWGWEIDDNGDLHLTLIETADDDWHAFESAFSANPWVRVGDVEDPNTAINGVFRAEILFDDLTRAGIDDETAGQHAGVWTLEFEDGLLTVTDTNHETGVTTLDRGVYCVEGNEVKLGLIGAPPECGDFWSAVWVVDGDEIRFTDVRSGHGSDRLIEALFGNRAFVRTG